MRNQNNHCTSKITLKCMRMDLYRWLIHGRTGCELNYMVGSKTLFICCMSLVPNPLFTLHGGGGGVVGGGG